MVSGLRYPSGFDIGPATPTGYQLRVGLGYSVIDPVRALRLHAAADADCAAEQTRADLSAALEAASGSAEIVAQRAKAEFIKAHQTEVDSVVQRARERMRERLITLFELNHILDLADGLERKAAVAAGAAARLEAVSGSETKPTLKQAKQLSEELARKRETHEDELSSVRTLDAWNLRLQGGVIPLEGPKLDWYGWVEVSYNLGGPFQSAAERRFREARRKELASDVAELPAKLARQSREQSAQAEQAAAELKVMEKRLGYLKSIAAEMEGNEPASSHARDALSITQLEAEAERVYLQRLLDALSAQRSSNG
jgi:hypothetical protein